MSGLTESVPLTNLEQTVHRINELQTLLQAQAPSYENLLQQIHIILAKDPDMVHMLTNEQVGVIVSGLSRKTNIVLTTPANPTKKQTLAGGKKLKDATLDDI